MSNDLHIILMVSVMALVTIAIRFLPFALFGSQHHTPDFINYLGKVLPFAIMAMLVVFSLRHISLLNSPYGLPELSACLVVAALQFWKRNTLVSIVCGTACYMLLVQAVF